MQTTSGAFILWLTLYCFSLLWNMRIRGPTGDLSLTSGETVVKQSFRGTGYQLSSYSYDFFSFLTSVS